MAMDIAVSFAWDVGVQEVIFETDSHVIFTTLSGSTIPPATVIDVLESVQQKLHEFRRVKVQHVRRQGNKSAQSTTCKGYPWFCNLVGGKSTNN